MASVISESINRWKDAVKKKEDPRIIGLFVNGNSFRYTVPKYADQCAVLHVYPGIVTDPTDATIEKLVYYVIPADYDTPAHSSDYEQYTKACPLEYNLSSNRIPDSEAKVRIKNWKDYHDTWIPKQNATADGLFLAFVLERIDFEVKDTYVSMGLKANGEQAIPFTADLIVSNIDADKTVVYDDFAMPVPPYGGASASSQSNFYLLTIQ